MTGRRREGARAVEVKPDEEWRGDEGESLEEDGSGGRENDAGCGRGADLRSDWTAAFCIEATRTRFRSAI